MSSLPSCSPRIVFSLLALLGVATGPVAEAATGYAQAGQSVTLSLTANGTAPFAYQWYKNGVLLPGATAPTYVLGSFQAAQAGQYAATVANGAGWAASDAASLVLVAPPVITTQPASQTVPAGGALLLTVTATGTPAPTYQWRRDGVILAGETGSSYAVASASGTHAGLYTVVVANVAGTAVSPAANVNVTYASPPVITTSPASQTVPAGGPVTFVVVATGSPAPTYQWRKNGAAVPGATGSTLAIATTTLTDAGSYSVVLTNAAGAVVSAPAVLTVNVVAAAGLDFNRDGWSDILWQCHTTGERVLWLMRDTEPSGFASLGTVAPVWDLVGAADLTKDGQPDLLWQNLSTGERVLWPMQGTKQAGDVKLGTVPIGWDLIGAADLNQDGSPDLLWQHLASGERVVWLMDGVHQAGTVYLPPVSPGWDLVGAADFNRDGHPDLVWQNLTSGERVVWLMNRTQQAGTVYLPTVPGAWRVVSAVDYNRDGYPDLLWQNTVTGERAIWLMAGTQWVVTVPLPKTATEWQMVD